jgi:hypothetical protein
MRAADAPSGALPGLAVTSTALMATGLLGCAWLNWAQAVTDKAAINKVVKPQWRCASVFMAVLGVDLGCRGLGGAVRQGAVDHAH